MSHDPSHDLGAGWSPSSSAPACWSPSWSAPASPPNGSRPTTSACSCWRTRPPPFLGLTVLILMFGPVSGAHFNPVVSAADWLLGRRGGTGLTGAEVLAYSAAQVVGAIAGAVLANVMFEVPVTELATTDRTGTNLWLGEVVATAGLVVLIFALARTGRGMLAAPAVGAYIGAAYWFTSSHLVRQPRGHHRPRLLRHLRRHRTRLGARVRRRPARRRRRRRRRRALPLPGRRRRRRRRRRPPSPRRTQETPMTVTPRHPSGVPQVVFACVRNGGRSVASRVLTEHYAGGRVARRLGRHPARRAHPPRGRRGAREARPRHLPRAPQAAHPGHDRGQRPRHHPRLRRGMPVRARA